MKRKLLMFLLLIVVIIIFNWVMNIYRMETTHYDITSSKVTEEYTFVQIADYHSKEKEDQKILEITRESDPDYILLNGDILQSPDMTSTVNFVEELTKIATVIYARGNHDDDYSNYEQFASKLKEIGVIVLEQETYQIDNLNFIGLEDIDEVHMSLNHEYDREYARMITKYQPLVEEDMYNIFLAHRPVYFEDYVKLGVDLIVSGHAHGGQSRIPFTGIGALAPEEGIIATHVYGLFNSGSTYQSVSAGVSNPYEPLGPRLFNPKEVVVITVSPE